MSEDDCGAKVLAICGLFEKRFERAGGSPNFGDSHDAARPFFPRAVSRDTKSPTRAANASGRVMVP